MARSLLLSAAFALVLGTATELRGAEMVWSGLVIAENVAQPHPIPPELTAVQFEQRSRSGRLAQQE